jgi:hypothetical protein
MRHEARDLLIKLRSPDFQQHLASALHFGSFNVLFYFWHSMTVFN